MSQKFDDFFLKNYPKVKSFAIRILMSEYEAEDVAQEVFIKLLDMPEVWDDKKEHTTFLYTVTKNHIFNLLKRKAVERKYQERIFQKNMLVEEFGLEKEIYAKELELAIMNAIEKMPEQRKKIFKMSRLEGKSNPEISEILNLSIRTVERHIYLALSELKKILFFLVF